MSSLNDFKLGKLLGKGAFSKVFLVHRIIDGQTYAMKQVRISQLTDKEKKNALNEIRILASLSHKNIIGYKDAFFDENSKTLNIVMEYADNGDMSQKIKYNLKHGLLFRENIIWNYLIQILEGLHYLHENNIIHRDLKSANIYLMKDGTVKIGDLNVSKIAKIGMAYTQTGTPYYASPEIWLDKPYDFKSDVWSLGCILYELCQLKPPFRGTSLKNLCYNIQRGIYEPIMSFYSEELKKIIYLMLRTDPNMRPSTGQILKSKLINNKKKELKIGQELDRIELERYQKKELIDTIKMPRNMREINGNLPTNKYNKNKTKKLNEEMMKEDEYETNKRLNGFLNDEDKKEIQKLYGNNYNNKINEINNLNINNYGLNNGSNKNNYLNNDINNKFNNNFMGNQYQINNYNNNDDKNRINNNIIKNKQNIFNKNINNSDRAFINNDFSSINHKINDKNNKDDLISLNYNLMKHRKKIPNNKFMRNMSDIEDNNNYIYKQNKTKENRKQKNKNIDDYISQNINIYNNINKYYYRNYLDLLSYNGDKLPQKHNMDKINMQKRPSNNDLFKNKINSDKSPSKFNYIFNNGNQFNNIKPENKLNNSISNTDTYTNDNKHFKLLMNNNYNPNININIYNNKEDKKPNLNNFDFINNNINNGLYFKISPTKEKNNKNPTLDINLLESSSKKGKDNLYFLNDLEDINNNAVSAKNRKGVIRKIKTENNVYLDKKNKNIIESINNRRQSDTESLNSQIFKLNKNEINNKNNQYNNRYTNINKQGKIETNKTPKLKQPKNNNKRKKVDNVLDNNNQISLKNDMNDNYSNNLLNNKNNNYQRNVNNNLKKPNLLLNLDDYHPQLYVGINNKYRNYKKFENNYVPYPSSENRFDGIINNKLRSNGLNLDNNIKSINNRNNNNAIEKIMQKNRSEYLKKLSNNLVSLNENDNIIFNNKISNNNKKYYQKQTNFIHRMANNGDVNRSKKRPVSSIVQRKIENDNSNRFKRLEPSFNNQLNKIKNNNNNKFNDSLDEISNINNFYSNKNKLITEANNMNNIRLNKLDNINNNNDLMNYRNKVKKNKLEIINNFNNYIEHKNKIKNDYRKIEINYNNKSEKMRNINRNNNQRVITPSPDIFDKRNREENGKMHNKYKLKKLNGKIGSSKGNITDLNESLSYLQNNYNNYNVNKINKIEVQIHPKRKGKVIIEKYDYQPIKNRLRNNNQNIQINNNMKNYHYLMDEYKHNNNNQIFEKYNINNNNNLFNNKFLNDSDLNENKNKKQINYLDYNNYHYQNEIKYDNINNFINNNIYGKQNKINNFILKQDLNKYNRNYNNNMLFNEIPYSIGNNENLNSFLNYLNYDYKL